MARVPFEAVEEWMASNDLRPSDAARAFGVSTQRFNGWRNRGQVSADASDAVLERMRLSVSRVSETEMNRGYLCLQLLDGVAGMGDAVANTDFPEVIREMEISEQQIRSLLGFLPRPGRLALMTGRGMSMEPLIRSGDVVIVDTQINYFDGDGPYVINLGSGQQIKNLQDRGNGIFVVSANESAGLPAFPAPPEMLIGGRVHLIQRLIVAA